MIRAAALLVAVIALGGCAGTLTVTDGPKVVSAHPLPSYQVHEECFKLGDGDRVDFAFESSEPVDFNIHYHEGQAVVMPISVTATAMPARFTRLAPAAVGSRTKVAPAAVGSRAWARRVKS